ncbi:hypothetical protein [Enterococcus sp. DIV0876]|uniref:hypothetical protein n=1 Tax=Enterococcus sp. DIV0876 TaxID=2774633 RepID=UPI003D2FF0F7
MTAHQDVMFYMNDHHESDKESHNQINRSKKAQSADQQLLNACESVEKLFTVGDNKIDIVQFQVPAAFSGRRLRDLYPANLWRVFVIKRKGQGFIPALTTFLEHNDIVYCAMVRDNE